jgi:AraC family transcriptional regulator of adaptative response/methylated-DNA-[protein]-cysteine methyltransferase
LLAVAKDDGLCLLEFVDRKALASQIAGLAHGRRTNGATVVPGEHPHLEQIADELERYFEGTLSSFETPLCFIGTEFQRTVWKELLRIPHGETTSYGELATKLGRPGSQRAVARANGQNRLGIVVPCHRVIGADGALRGYGGGVWRKRWLIDHERSSVKAR